MRCTPEAQKDRVVPRDGSADAVVRRFLGVLARLCSARPRRSRWPSLQRFLPPPTISARDSAPEGLTANKGLRLSGCLIFHGLFCYLELCGRRFSRSPWGRYGARRLGKE